MTALTSVPMTIRFHILLLGVLFLSGCDFFQSSPTVNNEITFPDWPGVHSTATGNSTNNSTASSSASYNRNSTNLSFNGNSVPAGHAQHIVLLLPLQGGMANAGNTIRDGFMYAYHQAGQQNVQVDVVDTSQSGSIISAYNNAVQKGADFIVGPLTKPDVAQLENAHLAVPTLALNSTGANNPLPPNLYEFGLSPLDEASQIADRAAADHHHAALLIAPGNAWGHVVAYNLMQAWQQQGGQIVGTLWLTNQNTDLNSQIEKLLHANNKNNSHRQDMDAIFLIASPAQAGVIKPLLKYYYVGDTPVYATSMVNRGAASSGAGDDLDGIMFTDIPFVLDTNGGWAAQRNQIGQLSGDSLRLYALGIDSYRLSQELNHVGSTPSSGIPGATGQLSLSQQHIHRQLQWAEFRGGSAVISG